MVAAMVERPVETVVSIAVERRVEVVCVHCLRTHGRRRVIGVFGIRGDLPPGAVWTRIKCPDRRCDQWSAFDVATGQPLGARPV